jgi:hypothetical protein
LLNRVRTAIVELRCSTFRCLSAVSDPFIVEAFLRGVVHSSLKITESKDAFYNPMPSKTPPKLPISDEEAVRRWRGAASGRMVSVRC